LNRGVNIYLFVIVFLMVQTLQGSLKYAGVSVGAAGNRNCCCLSTTQPTTTRKREIGDRLTWKFVELADKGQINWYRPDSMRLECFMLYHAVRLFHAKL